MTPRTHTHDAIIIGAGVAGAATAIHLATHQDTPHSILLIERSPWPRTKVCGCCLNPAGVAELDALGVLPSLLTESRPVDHARVSAPSHLRTSAVARFHHPGGRAIDRAHLDALLVTRFLSLAQSTRSRFLPESTARVMPRADRFWTVHTSGPDGHQIHRAKHVIIADGLTGSSLDTLEVPGLKPRIAPACRIGLATTIPTTTPTPGVIRMHLARSGYVGLVDLPSHQTALAAAIDPRLLRAHASPRDALAALLARIPEALTLPPNLRIRATGLLTRHRPRIAAPGLSIIGDAAGYIEPFSGEGMTWALTSARALATLIHDSLISHHADLPSESTLQETARHWEHFRSTTLHSRQRWAGLLRTASRHPTIAASLLHLCANSRLATSTIEACIHRTARPYTPFPDLASPPLVRTHSQPRTQAQSRNLTKEAAA